MGVVWNSSVPLTLVPLDATNKVGGSAAYFEQHTACVCNCIIKTLWAPARVHPQPCPVNCYALDDAAQLEFWQLVPDPHQCACACVPACAYNSRLDLQLWTASW
jgi:hypothetical protein